MHRTLKKQTFMLLLCIIGELNYGIFVPTYFRSRQRKFHSWNFRSLNFRSLELSSPGTFAPKSENDVELSLPARIISDL